MDVINTVDIGGTQLRAAVYPVNNIKPFRQKRISTRGKESAHARLINLIGELRQADEDDQLITSAALGDDVGLLGALAQTNLKIS